MEAERERFEGTGQPQLQLDAQQEDDVLDTGLDIDGLSNDDQVDTSSGPCVTPAASYSAVQLKNWKQSGLLQHLLRSRHGSLVFTSHQSPLR